MKTKLFTLAELMVVLAIIGILASLLMPTLRRARWEAQKAVCLNNEQQQYIGYSLYSQDNNGRVPLHRSSDDPHKSNWINSRGKFYNWGVVYRDGYLTTDEILADPTYQGTNDDMVVTGSNYNDINDILFDRDDPDIGHLYKKKYKLKTHYSVRPLKEREDVESDQAVKSLFYANKAMFSCGLYGMYLDKDGGAYHAMKGINTAYFDGSAKFIKGGFITSMLTKREKKDYWGDADLENIVDHPTSGFWAELDAKY